MIDLCAKKHHGWKRVLTWALKIKDSIKLDFLRCCTELGIPGSDWEWLAQELWTFLGDVISKQLYTRRRVLAGGEEDNGLELWRRFFLDDEGTSAVISLRGRRSFFLFPKCDSIKNLTQHCDAWYGEYQEHGADLPTDFLLEMFIHILPDDVQKEIRRNKEIQTHHQAYAYVIAENSRLNNERLADVHSHRRDKELSAKSEASFIHAAVPQEHNGFFEGLVAALEKRFAPPPPPRGPPRPRPPARRQPAPGRQLSDPKWRDGGCWHCGQVGHKSNACPVYGEILKKNGGKRPDNYKSAYDIDMEKAGAIKQTSSVTAGASTGATTAEQNNSQTQQQPQHPHDDIIAQLIDRERAEGTGWAVAGSNIVRSNLAAPVLSLKKSFENPKHFSVLNDFHAEDDEDAAHDFLAGNLCAPVLDISQHLCQNPTCKHTRMPRMPPRPPQRQHATKSTDTTSLLNAAQIDSICKHVTSGKPLTQLQIAAINNHVKAGGPTGLPPAAPGARWSLVDSGAEPHAANHARHFPGATLRPHNADDNYVAANGSKIQSGEMFQVPWRTIGGKHKMTDFRDADVAFPILSTGRLTDENDSLLLYHKRGGSIIDPATLERDHFTKALGVYWIQMVVEPHIIQGFHRQT